MFGAEMVSDTVRLQLNEALLLYSMGFSIQIATYKDNIKNITIIPENNITSCTFDEYLYNHNIWDQDHNLLRKVKFYTDSDTLNHVGLHVMYDDGTPNTIEYGKFIEMRQKLLELQEKYDIEEMYVQRNIMHIQMKIKK